jgi:hypothetical protein
MTAAGPRLDSWLTRTMLEAMLPVDDVLHQNGYHGPRVDMPDDAAVQTRLLAFIGRNPR